MHIQYIPLSKLTPSKMNVRKTGAANGIEELAASIAAHGLLQNLAVRVVGKQRFEVVAGGRRLAALKRLAKEKRLTKDVPIPCNVLDEEDAEEISLAENVVRLPMHPADQFEAFQRLVDSGKGPEEIAARFGVSVTTVKQRLKLANVSPMLMEAYRADELDLDRLIAFAVTDDHAAQEGCWRDLPSWNNGPNTIRRILTHAQIGASDRRARFVGLEAYKQAGGQITRDLFQPEYEGWLADAALLERLATQKLEALADTLRAEGWAWVEIEPEHGHSLSRIQAERLPLKPEQEDELARLSAQYDALPEDDETDEQAEQRETLYAKLEALAEGEAIWTDDQKSIAGVVIRIRHDGEAEIDRGLVKPEDRAALCHLTQPEDAEDGYTEAGCPVRPAGLSAKLVEDLTAHRTAALQALMADSPSVALASVVHALAWPVFYGAGIAPTCLEITARQPDLTRSSDNLASCPAAQLLEERRSAWQSRQPEEQDGFFPWLLAQDMPTLTDLLALVTALTVNAVRQPGSHYAAPRFAHADQLATALTLNMTAWWQPTGDTYLSRVSKAHILEAVKEGVSAEAAENLASLKKGDLVVRAEERLTGRGWLPLALRLAE